MFIVSLHVLGILVVNFDCKYTLSTLFQVYTSFQVQLALFIICVPKSASVDVRVREGFFSGKV